MCCNARWRRQTYWSAMRLIQNDGRRHYITICRYAKKDYTRRYFEHDEVSIGTYTLIWIVFPQISALHSQELHNRAGKLRKSLEAFHHNSFRKNKISRSNRSSAFKNIKILHDHLPHLPSLWIFTITSSCQTVCSISNLLWNQSFHDKCATVSHVTSRLIFAKSERASAESTVYLTMFPLFLTCLDATELLSCSIISHDSHMRSFNICSQCCTKTPGSVCVLNSLQQTVKSKSHYHLSFMSVWWLLRDKTTLRYAQTRLISCVWLFTDAPED